MGGLWMGITFMGFFIVKISNNDEQLYQEVAKNFFRKPEVYKFAYAKRIDAKDLLQGRITIEQFNSLQQESNLESMKQRTLRDLVGDIKRPSYFEVAKMWIRGLKSGQSFEKQTSRYMTTVDQICYNKAKKKIDEELLDVGHLIKQNRQNEWLKDIFLSTVQLKYLDQSFKMIIDPRSEKNK